MKQVNSSPAPAITNARAVIMAIMAVLLVAGAILAGTFIFRLGVDHLSRGLAADRLESFRALTTWVAVTTSGIPAVLTIVLVLFDAHLNFNAKAINRIVVLIWVFFATAISVLYGVLQYGPNFTAGLGDIAQIGAVIYAAIGGLNLVAMVAVALVTFTGSSDAKSVSGAVGGILIWSTEATLAGAGFGFEAYYGMSIGIAPLVAVLAAMLAAFGFVMSLAKIHDSRQRRDVFDQAVWGVVGLVFTCYIGSVGAAAGAHLSGKESTIPEAVLWVGSRAFFFSQFLLAFVLLAAKLMTDAIDVITLEPTPAAEAESVPHVRPLRRLAAGVVNLKDDIRALTGEFRMVPREQLPAASALHNSAPVDAMAGATVEEKGGQGDPK